MSSENNAGTANDVTFNSLVQVLVSLIEKGEVGVLVPGSLKQKLSGDARNGDGSLEDIDAFLEIKIPEVFYGLDEWLDIKIVILDEEVPKCLHPLIAPYSLTICVLFLRNVAAFQLTVEGLIWWESCVLQLTNVIKPFVGKESLL